MPKHSITLDLLKEIQVIPEEVEVRVGEADSQTIDATLTEKGLPYTVPEGQWSAAITLLTAAKNTKTQLASISEDRKALSVTLADEMLTDEGTCGLAYFKLTGPDGEILTTEGFILRIQGSTITSENGQSWDQEIADLKQSFALEIEKIREDEKTRIENELIRIAQEAAREAAEALRKSAESSRDAAEGERASAEEGRDASEQKRDAAEKLRASEEEKRAAAEKLRETAEGERDAAEDERASSEQARDAAERVRETQEGKREENEAARKRAEADRVAAEGTRATQEAERVASEEKRAADFTASQDANAKAFAASEQSRQETFDAAEAKRAEGEAEREEAEGKRAEAEGLRDAAETVRKQAEADRVAAETARDAAEKLRAQAEELRAEAEKLRAEAEIAREAAQAKNNADQAANNQAAQGRLTRILVEGEYDPETGVPTIEGDLTHVFAVPNAEYEAARADLEEAEAAHEAAVAKLRSVERKMGDATGDGPTYDGQVELAQASLDLSAAALEKAQATFEAKNKYVEWLWLFDNDGVGFWEQYGTGSQILPDPVTSEEIDRMWAGEPVESNHLVYTTGLNYDVQKAQAALSAHATVQKATDSAQDTSIAAAQAAAEAAQAAAESAKSTAASELADAVATQATKDSTQDTSIAAAKKAGDDAASALAAYKTAQATTDSEQDTAIAAAKKAGTDAAAAIAPAVTASETAMKKWVGDEAKAHSATSADVATKLGTETVGSATLPIYLLGGIATAIAKVAAAATADTATSATSAETAAKLGGETVGSETQGIYLDGGTPKPTTGQAGPTMEEFNALKAKLETLEQTVSTVSVPWRVSDVDTTIMKWQNLCFATFPRGENRSVAITTRDYPEGTVPYIGIVANAGGNGSVSVVPYNGYTTISIYDSTLLFWVTKS